MIAFNAFSQLVGLGITLLIQTVYMIVSARVLGPHDFGLYSFGWSIAQILLIGGDFGIHNTALRAISRNPARSREVVPVFLGLKLVVGGLLLAIVLGVAVVVDLGQEARWMLVVLGVGMVLQSIAMGLSVVFQSHGRLYFGSFNIVMLFFIQAMLGVIFLWQGGRLVALALAYAIAATLAAGVNATLLWRRIHPLSVRFAGARSFAFQSVPVGLSTLLQSLSSRIEVMFLTFLTAPYDAGIFAAAARIPQSLGNVPVAIFSAVLPSLAAFPCVSRGFKRRFKRSLGLMIVLSLPAAVCLYSFGRPVLLVVFGSEYSASIPALRILSWAVIPVFVGMAFSHVFLSRRELVGRLVWVSGTGLGVHVALSLILIPRLGTTGAAWAFLGAETVLAIAYALGASTFLAAPIRDEPPIHAEGRSRIGLVVQRYGADVIGGAETLARELSLRLSPKYAVEVLTSCARDYTSWDNYYPEGSSWDGPVLVRRFSATWHRHWRLFGWVSSFLFALQRNLSLPSWMERFWVRFQGPNVPDLVQFLERSESRYDAVLFFTYLYYPTVFGLPRLSERAILVPTAHDEPAARFSIYRKLFAQPRCLVFMTDHEREFVHREFGNEGLPNVVAGFGVAPVEALPERGDYLLYIGRIEIGKGVSELLQYCRDLGIKLKVAGPSQIPVGPPAEFLGVVDEATKLALLRGCLAVAVPSKLESLSILALEAWAHGKPVIARRGGVVGGLVEESGGGYCYENQEEFRRILETLDSSRGLRGREFVRERFSWEVVLERFEKAIESCRPRGGQAPA